MSVLKICSSRRPLQLFRCWALLLLGLLPISEARAEAPNCGSWSNFDEHGVALMSYGGEIGVQYNATTIASIANVCLGRYKAFRMPEDWRIVTAQIDWLRNNAVSVTDDAAVYLHDFPWSMGLKPGWRSGSSQMNAIIAMIAYYRESGDQSILPVIRRVKNGMMLPVSEGGTTAVSPEGGLWIEEFPTDPPSLALGSFINSIIALHEVAELFPDDARTRSEFEAAVSSLKLSLRHYDSGNWTYVYRWPGLGRPALADEMYGPAFPRLLQELAEITKDPLILATSLRWRSFYEDVNLRSQGNVLPDEHGTYRLAPGLPKRELADTLKGNVDIIRVSPDPYPDYGADNLFDNNMNTYLSMGTGPARLHFRLHEPKLVNTLRLSLYSVDLYPKDLQIEIAVDGEQGFRSIPFVEESSRRHIYYHFDPVWAEELRISASRFSQQDRLVLSGLALGAMNWSNREKPTYCSHTTPPVELDAPAFRIQIEAPPESAKQIYLIYRHAPDRAGIEGSPWQWDYVDPFEPREIAATDRNDKIYQFRVLCTPEAGYRGWRWLTVSKANGEVAYREGS